MDSQDRSKTKFQRQNAFRSGHFKFLYQPVGGLGANILYAVKSCEVWNREIFGNRSVGRNSYFMARVKLLAFHGRMSLRTASWGSRKWNPIF